MLFFYLNELKDNKPIELTVDRITLEDMIKFQEIKFEFIEGICVSLKNSNKNLGKVIYELYCKRLKVKKENPPMGELIKLILNSIYGKTIPKMVYSNECIVYEEKLNDYINKNFHIILKVIIKQLNFLLKILIQLNQLHIFH